jgi:hypothetical protein
MTKSKALDSGQYLLFLYLLIRKGIKVNPKYLIKNFVLKNQKLKFNCVIITRNFSR